MNHRHLLFCTAGWLLALTGSALAQDNVSQPPPASVPAGAEHLRTMRFEERADFLNQLRNVVVKLDGRINELSASSHNLPANSPRARALEEARSARLVLEHQLGKISQAAASNWALLRESVLDALAQTEAACDHAEKA